MRIRAPRSSERIIIAAFLDQLAKAKADPDNNDSRNMIYARVAQRCGVTYDRVVDLCHDRIYIETSPGVHENAWKRGII